MSVVTTIALRNPDWDKLSPEQLAQADAAAAAHARAARDEQWIADLNGNPPRSIVDTLTLGSSNRALLSRYLKWCEALETVLSSLQAKRAELQDFIDAPHEIEAKIGAAVKRKTDQLLGRSTDNSDEGERKSLDDQLAARRHRAEAARAALVELEPEIERAQMRVARLNERENEFVRPVLLEIADQLPLTQAYMATISELQKLASLIHGLNEAVGGFGLGVESPKMVKLLRPATASAADMPDEAFTIVAKGNAEIWRKIAEQLKADPKYDVAKLVEALRQ